MITIIIDTANEAFEDYPEQEVARILEELTKRFKTNTIHDDHVIRDINGNRVGNVQIEEL